MKKIILALVLALATTPACAPAYAQVDLPDLSGLGIPGLGQKKAEPVQLPDGQMLGGEQQDAPAGTVPEWMTYQDPYGAKGTDKSAAHRSQTEIIAWVQNKTTDALTFSPENFREKLGQIKPTFTADGWQGYSDFMRGGGIADSVQNKGYIMGSIVNGEVAMLNHGEVAGSYHWLLEVPVVVSFAQKGSDGKVRQMPGGGFTIKVMVGRTSTDILEDGLAFESWEVKRAN